MFFPNSPHHAGAIFCSSPQIKNKTISILGYRKWRRSSSWSCTALISVALLLIRHHGGQCARLDADVFRRIQREIQRDNTLSQQPRRQRQQQVRIDHPCGGSKLVASDVIDDMVLFDRSPLHQQQQIPSYDRRLDSEVISGGAGVENGQERDEGPGYMKMTSSRPPIHGDARTWLVSVRDMLEHLCRDIEQFKAHYVSGHTV